MIAPELRRARGRSDQGAGNRTAAAAEFTREFESNHRTHAVAEEREGLSGVRLDGIGKRVDERAHPFERRLCQSRFPPGKSDRDVACLPDPGSTAGMRKPEETWSGDAIRVEEPGRAGGSLTESQS